jgi:hypothetical protein
MIGFYCRKSIVQKGLSEWEKRGVEVEKEHTKDEKLALKIARDHLAEDPDYYKDWDAKEKILFEPKAPAKKSFYVKSEQFFIDLMKADRQGPHRYIRKYMRGGKAVYVYKEPEGKARVMKESELTDVKRLAELEHEHARRMVDNIKEVHPQDLDDLRKLSDLGHKPATKHLKEHYAIDREAEKLEEAVVPRVVADQDPIDKKLKGAELKHAHQAIDAVVKAEIFDRLRSHASNPLSTNLARDGITQISIMRAVKRKDNIREMLQELHKQMTSVDAAHVGLTSSQVASGGGYGSNTYDVTVKRLERNSEFLPVGYHKAHSRKGRSGDPNFKPHGIREHERKMEEKAQKERERAARERVKLEREHGALLAKHGESADDMISYFGGTSTMAEKVNLMKGIDKFFGKDFKFKEFKNDVTRTAPGVEVKIGSGFISDLARGNTYVGVTFSFIEKSTGAHITTASREITKKSDGSIFWYNSVFRRPDNKYLAKHPGMAKGLYGGVEKFLKDVTKNYPAEAKKNTVIKIGAANDGFGNGYKGGLVWANHYFDFASANTAASWKSTWKTTIRGYASRLGWSDAQTREITTKIDGFKYPYEFVKMGIPLTKAQAEAATRRSLDFDFNQIIKRSKKKKQAAGASGEGTVDLGAVINVANSMGWSCINYVNRKTGRSKHLNEKRAVYYGHAEPTRRRTA